MGNIIHQSLLLDFVHKVLSTSRLAKHVKQGFNQTSKLPSDEANGTLENHATHNSYDCAVFKILATDLEMNLFVRDTTPAIPLIPASQGPEDGWQFPVSTCCIILLFLGFSLAVLACEFSPPALTFFTTLFFLLFFLFLLLFLLVFLVFLGVFLLTNQSTFMWKTQQSTSLCHKNFQGAK